MNWREHHSASGIGAHGIARFVQRGENANCSLSFQRVSNGGYGQILLILRRISLTFHLLDGRYAEAILADYSFHYDIRSVRRSARSTSNDDVRSVRRYDIFSHSALHFAMERNSQPTVRVAQPAAAMKSVE